MANKHWSKQQERGNALGLNIIRLVVKYCPLWLIRFVTFTVVCYFFVTSPQARKNIKQYQQNLTHYDPKVKLGRFSVFKQFLAFGESIIDRFAIWQHRLSPEQIIIDDADNLSPQMDGSGRGQLVVCSHFGNTEICLTLIGQGQYQHFHLNALVYNRHAEIFNQTLAQAGANTLPFIQVDSLDAQKMFEIHQRIEQGEWLAIAADRTPIRGEKSLPISFLGQYAEFPQGAWLLASILKIPINTVFCLKENGKYRFKVRRFLPEITGSGKQREQHIAIAMQKYADLLAEECRQNPLLWFNFYDFWNKGNK
ncbi:glycosyl transferase family 2 [Volucribacter amazonae]|uniref:Glycosyl transferase family 2 n=1 Tax=Volucribacter amazonae TaxID=256731 RepID=A0A9X4PJ03_9PAST|nr:glycosyl transferase family 2 [Volucribacter amazonae]MDG6896260.1 glycosyl transferase family 2 [Volucribacter amazonae]